MQGKIAKSNNFLLVVNAIFSTKIEMFSREHCSCYLFPDEMELD